MRRERVEKIAARGAKINHAKAPRSSGAEGDGAAATDHVPGDEDGAAKSLGAEQRYTIDWDEPVVATQIS